MIAQSQDQLVYALDKTHTTVEFVVRHLMITKVRGRFSAFEGRIELARGSQVPQRITATIDTASINTHEEQRDAHLRSADFLEVEKYPTMVFESTRIDGASDDFKIVGNLTLHGVTREVTLTGQFEGSGADPWGGQRVGYAAHTTIDRRDFGLTWNSALEAGGVVVGDQVRIEINAEAVLQA